jgi:3-hydroxyisobutyrate dehydrogenase
MIGSSKPEASDPTALQIELILQMMGDAQKIFWCEKPGAGMAAKICNNYIVCTVFVVLLEALALGVGSGCSAKVLLEVIHNSSGQTYIGDIMSKSRVGLSQSSTNLMLKDIALGVEAAAKAEIQIQVGQVALDIWKETARDPAVMDKYLKSLFGGDHL